MTDSAPILVDKDQKEAVILIDLENIRLSWQKVFNQSLQYEDLRFLCDLLKQQIHPSFSTNDAIKYLQVAAGNQSNFPESMKILNKNLRNRALRVSDANATVVLNDSDDDDLDNACSGKQSSFKISAFIIFMSDPKEHRLVALRQHPAQMKFVNNSNPNPGAKSGLSESEKPKVEDFEEEFNSIERIHRLLKRDAEATNLKENDVALGSKTDNTKHKNGSTSPDDIILEEDDTVPPPPYRVEVKTFGYKKGPGGRGVVQRACDVAVGSACTKICFMPNVDLIILLSADSDFEVAARECLKAEDCGGVIKFKKQIIVSAFTAGFANEKRKLARVQREIRHFAGRYRKELMHPSNSPSLPYFPFQNYQVATAFRRKAEALLLKYKNYQEQESLNCYQTEGTNDSIGTNDSVEYYLFDEDFRNEFKLKGLTFAPNVYSQGAQQSAQQPIQPISFNTTKILPVPKFSPPRATTRKRKGRAGGEHRKNKKIAQTLEVIEISDGEAPESSSSEDQSMPPVNEGNVEIGVGDQNQNEKNMCFISISDVSDISDEDAR